MPTTINYPIITYEKNGTIDFLFGPKNDGVVIYDTDTSAPHPVVVHAGDGNDIVFFTNSKSTIYGGAGNDLISPLNFPADNNPAALIDGGDGNDTLFGGRSNDTIYGGTGDDSTYGDAGDDQILFGSGADTVYGGDGNDYIDEAINVSNFDFANLLDGGNGNDTIFADAGNDTLYGGSGNDILNGETGDDLTYGEDGDDIILFGSGADTVYGGNGNDYIDDAYGVPNFNDANMLYGGDGNDTIFAGSGNDTLTGGAGDDLLYGEAGADTFVFASDFGNDTIKDFNSTQSDTLNADQVQFSKSLFVDWQSVLASSKQVGADVVITSADLSTLTLKNTLVTNLTSQNVLTV